MSDNKPEYFEHPVFGIYKAVIRDRNGQKNILHIAADGIDMALRIADDMASDLSGYVDSIKWINGILLIQGTEK